MAIPVYLQQFKAAGVYRVVFDKSTILNQDTQILRLVVGYSEVGPFNIPVLVKNAAEFKTLFGDISKKLEKRGIYFHRLALQMLTVSPIICLNLKKFDGETVSGATINTEFNPTFDPIDEVQLKVEDVYDTTRFWELNAEKLNGLRSVSGTVMDQYINLAITNTKNSSISYFIRKASGTKVAGYNITVNDWYSDEPMPEYLEGHEGNLISDFFAEIYVFKGKFTAKQVLASETLKNYFYINDKKELVLKDKIFDAFGQPVDTLDALYNDSSSNAIGHWVGSLIPYFKNKQGSYAALDVVFNSDIDVHNAMMSFNVDLLEDENKANIDLSGRLNIAAGEGQGITLAEIYAGNAKSSVLGNTNASIIADEIDFIPNVIKLENDKATAKIGFKKSNNSISGQLYVSAINGDTITVKEVGDSEVSINIVAATGKGKELAEKFGVQFEDTETEGVKYTQEEIDAAQEAYGKTTDDWKVESVEGVKYTQEEIEAAQEGDEAYGKTTDDWKVEPVEGVKYTQEEIDAAQAAYGKTTDDWKVEPSVGIEPIEGAGTYWTGAAFSSEGVSLLAGPDKVITSILRIEKDGDNYTDADNNVKVNIMDVFVETIQNELNEDGANAVYGSSISFIKKNDNWEFNTEKTINGIPGAPALISTTQYDKSLLAVLSKGDCLLADDNTVDYNGDGEENDANGYYDNVFVQEVGTVYKEDGSFDFHYVLVTAEPTIYDNTLVRIDSALNKEIGIMKPMYLEGYTYKNDKPLGQGMYAKVQWQNFILSALTDYKGLRTGLLNKAEIDYRYVIDTFESFPTTGLKNVLSFLCKEKQSAFCIANFPSVQTFVKCPYTSFTDNNGLFNVNYVVQGYNKKKAAALKFGLPGDSDGASFIAFYTPLKFSDGFVDSVVPAAGLVSNLFIEKYMSRQPYYIVAGPNYGAISASGLVGPDYRYSVDELQVIEPFGVNCMVYRPTFGTFINANQTAKQTPVSALSKVHVRELVIYLQDEIEKVLQAHQWEFNNQTTRNAILDKANSICSLVASNGGLQAYQNIMDESNNTPEIIDNEMAVLSTHIEPGMGCGKMVQELTLYRTGQMKAAIS